MTRPASTLATDADSDAASERFASGSELTPPRSVRVAWLMAVVAHYRVPLANALADMDGLDVTVYAGQEAPGVSVQDASSELEAEVRRTWNVRTSRRRARVAYTVGWLGMLMGRYDVLLISEATSNVAHWMLVALRRLFGARIVIIGQIRVRESDGGLARRLRPLLARSVDGLVAYTEDGRAQALAWGLSPERIIAMGNTIDVAEARRARSSLGDGATAALRQRLGAGGLVLLYVGRPVRDKRLDVAIDAVLSLKERGADVHLVVVGDGPLRGEFQQRADGSERIHFVGALYEQAELAPYFALADFVCIPGAVGLAINHAFAYGVPLLTARSDRHGPEMALARHGHNAWIVERCDAHAFAEAIEALSADPERIRSLRAGAESAPLPTVSEAADRIRAMVLRVTGRT